MVLNKIMIYIVFVVLSYKTKHLGPTLGPVVQNLTKLLANVTLTFLSWNMSNTLICFAEKIAKATHIFAAKMSMYLKRP